MFCKLSIIIPVYKVELFIRRCLDSIYCQGIDEDLFEVIIVNDGSPDNCQEIIQTEYLPKHANCTLVNQTNQGLSMARNNGLELAKGDYVWFVDSDDWLKAGAIQTIMSYIKKGYELLASNLEYVYDDSSRNHYERTMKEDIKVDAADYLFNYSIGAIQRYIIKRNLLIEKNLRFQPGILHEDAEFGPRLICEVGSVFITSTFLYNYYQREIGSIMSSWSKRNTECYIFVYHQLKAYSKSIKNKVLSNRVRTLSLNALCMAFPSKSLHSPDILHLYNENKLVIRKEAFGLLFKSGINFRKRLKLILIFICPNYNFNYKNR